jgi:hypothetical protein
VSLSSFLTFFFGCRITKLSPPPNDVSECSIVSYSDSIFSSIVKIHPFINEVLCSSLYKVTKFESLVKDEVVVHFDTWANESNLFFPTQVFKEHHYHPQFMPPNLD